MHALEEQFYELAAREVAERRLVPAVMAKAFSEADGDERKSIARYIKIRVLQLASDYDADLQRQHQQRAEAEQQKAKAEQDAASARGMVKVKCVNCDNSETLSKSSSCMAYSYKNFSADVRWLSGGLTLVCNLCKTKFNFSPPQ